MPRETHPVPRWIDCGAGTGGTSATIGRYLRYRRLATQLCVAEPRGGAFAEGFRSGSRAAHATQGTLIEGIGRPSVEPGFLFEIVDRVCEVDDAASIAAAWQLESLLGRRYGGSSGTNFVACLQLAADMRERGETGSIVTLLCDCGDRYGETLFNQDWLGEHGIDLVHAREAIGLLLKS
jgi:cysteine synthase A